MADRVASRVLVVVVVGALVACSADARPVADGAKDAGGTACAEPIALAVDVHLQADGGALAGSGGRTCTWSIPAPVAGEHRDRLALETRVPPANWSRGTMRVADASECAADGHDFYLDDAGAESTLTLCPEFCSLTGLSNAELRIVRSCSQ